VCFCSTLWSKISNALKGLDFRPRDFLAQQLSETSVACTIRVRRSRLGRLWSDLGSHACLNINGTLDQELLLANEDLAAENRILRAQIKGRLLLSDAKKLRWRKSPTGSDGRPWKNPRLSASRRRSWPGTESSSPRSSNGSKFRKSWGRPRVDKETERLVVRMAKQNPGWGYDRIVGAVANLGHPL
jgi:hypothetical protein